MLHAGATPPPPPPKHRRSFSGMRNPFALSSSPSLPAIGIGRPSLTIATPTHPSTSNESLAYSQSTPSDGQHRPSNSISNSNGRTPSLRAFGSKLFSTPTVPVTPRSVSNGSGPGGAKGFMAKLPFGSLSRSNSKTKVSSDLVSPFTVPSIPNEKDSNSFHDGPVMHISAFPPSPGSYSSEQSSPLERPTTNTSPNTPYYPPVLGLGLPRSPNTPALNKPISRPKPLGSESLLSLPAQVSDAENRSASPGARSLHSLNGV